MFLAGHLGVGMLVLAYGLECGERVLVHLDDGLRGECGVRLPEGVVHGLVDGLQCEACVLGAHDLAARVERVLGVRQEAEPVSEDLVGGF